MFVSLKVSSALMLLGCIALGSVRCEASSLVLFAALSRRLSWGLINQKIL